MQGNVVAVEMEDAVAWRNEDLKESVMRRKR